MVSDYPTDLKAQGDPTYDCPQTNETDSSPKVRGIPLLSLLIPIMVKDIVTSRTTMLFTDSCSMTRWNKDSPKSGVENFKIMVSAKQNHNENLIH